ncbi:MAG: hypothetical protein IJQ23_01255 [Clostridia bacterium]|nr:hypothetical protein [Clostridia bacterium]
MTTKKKIILTILLAVLVGVVIVAVGYTIHFIVRQSDINTAYFYEGQAIDECKFNSFQEYIDYQNNGGQFTYSTTKSIVIAGIVLFSEIIGIVFSIIFILRIWNILEVVKFDITQCEDIVKKKKGEKIKQKISKLERRL